MSKIFEENATKGDIRNIILNSLNNYIEYIDDSLIKKGMEAFDKLEEDGRIVDYSKCVDSIYSSNNRKNINHKIPTILCGSILLEKYDAVSKLEDEQLAILSHFIYIGDYDYLSSCIRIYDSSILSEICKKTKDWYDRESILEVTEDTYDMFFIAGDSSENIHDNLSKFVKNTSLEEFFDLKRKLDDRTRKYLEKEEFNI